MSIEELALADDLSGIDDVDDAAEEVAEEVVTLEDLATRGINLATGLDDRTLDKIATLCLEGFQRDLASRSGWESDVDAAMDAIGNDQEEGSGDGLSPDGLANVNYPLIEEACLQFNANAYPAIVNGERVVKGMVSGADPDGQKQARADRISEHMSYQLLEEMPEWEGETDTLLIHVAAAGMAYREITWDAENQRPRSEFITAKSLVVNQNCRNLQTVPLYTKCFARYPYEIEERMRNGDWRTCDITWEGEGDRDQAEQEMLESHLRYDLDEDGYAEPYVAVIHKQSQKVLSLRADFWPQDIRRDDAGEIQSVRRRVWIAAYPFIPDPRGGFLGIGFGRLLRAHADVINTMLNQMIDAGTLQNAGGGFIGNGIRLDGGRVEVAPGEWRMVPMSGQALAQNIVPLPAPGPSASMFQLLGMMVESGDRLAQIKDALTGDAPANTQPTTLMALIEQGMKVFSAIYKRLYRGLKAEYGMIYDLNREFLPDQAYFQFGDDKRSISKSDYSGDTDVRPVADPSVTTAPQRLAKAQFLAGYQDDPLMDPLAIRRRIFEAAQVPDSAALFKNEEQPDPMAAMAAEAAASDLAEKNAKIKNTDADTAKKQAEAEEAGLKAEQLRRELGVQDVLADQSRTAQAAQSGGMEGMAQPSGDQTGLGGDAGALGADQGGMDPGLLDAGGGPGPGPGGAFPPEGPGAGVPGDVGNLIGGLGVVGGAENGAEGPDPAQPPIMEGLDQ